MVIGSLNLRGLTKKAFFTKVKLGESSNLANQIHNFLDESTSLHIDHLPKYKKEISNPILLEHSPGCIRSPLIPDLWYLVSHPIQSYDAMCLKVFS